MSKNIIITILVGITCLMAGSLFVRVDRNVGGGGTFVTEAFDNCGNCFATTSPAYLSTTGTATSTITVRSEGAETIDLNMYVNASSTASKYLWSVEFSNNNVDWYCEDGKSLTSTVTAVHGADCVVHSWTPGKTTATEKNVTITPVASKYTRARIGVSDANGSLYSQLILKKNY